jgi:transcriptional regulator with XRE-family HTH domain
MRLRDTFLDKRRDGQHLTQEQLAKMLGSSQSRVAKMEAADSSVSMELLVRSLLMLGATRKEVGRVIARDSTVPAA